MRINATDAKNRFGSVCALAKSEPVFVEKSGQVDTVILSLAQYQALKASHNTKRLAARKKAFEAEFAAWIDAQNAWVQAYGVPGSDMRPW